VDKLKIKDYFSKVALSYDFYAHLQKRWANHLVSKIGKGKNVPCRVLDIGMGTGGLTLKLAKIFPQALIFGCDLASGMVECAKEKARKNGIKKVEFIEADFEYLPYFDCFFDLVISNVAFQWALDIDRAFNEAYRVLNKGGDFYLTLLGQNSLKELREALERINPASFSEHKFFKEEDIYLLMKNKPWQRFNVEKRVKKVAFKDILFCLKWLKAIGANYGIKLKADGLALGKQIFSLRKLYPKQFYLTFEIFYVWGENKL